MTVQATLSAALDAYIQANFGGSLGEISAPQRNLEDLLRIAQSLATGGGGGGDASAANQTAVQQNAGSDASKAVAIQGVTGGKPLAAKSSAFSSSQTLTRGANTDTYAANDVIFGAFQLASAGNSGGFIYLTDVDFLMNITYLPSGIGNLRMFLYNVTPPSAIADNDPFSLGSGDRASILTPQGTSLGTPALALGGGSLVLSLSNINKLIKLSGTSLFGYLVTEGAWVPTGASETATLRISTLEA